MKNYTLSRSKNVLYVFRQELHTLKSKQGIYGLTNSEKERLRDLSKWVLASDK